jgi:hypothetical protein
MIEPFSWHCLGFNAKINNYCLGFNAKLLYFYLGFNAIYTK